MAGFWAVTNDGHEVHINGNPDMAPETLAAIKEMLDAYARYDNARTKAFERQWESNNNGDIDHDTALQWFRLGADWYTDVWQKRPVAAAPTNE